jgi:hypothetical protein
VPVPRHDITPYPIHQLAGPLIFHRRPAVSAVGLCRAPLAKTGGASPTDTSLPGSCFTLGQLTAGEPAHLLPLLYYFENFGRTKKYQQEYTTTSIQRWETAANHHRAGEPTGFPSWKQQPGPEGGRLCLIIVSAAAAAAAGSIT